jgi:formylmethanofuran dehydrogenase subunit E
LNKFNLKRGLNGLFTYASLKCKPPYSCIVDGIQVSTGCTIGNGNLTVKESSKIEILFKNKGKQLTININPKLINHLNRDLKKNPDKDKLENLALYLNSLEDENLFIIKEN